MMMRRMAVLAMLVIVVGLAPLDVASGFCAKMPCCTHEEVPEAQLTAPNCCNAVACAESRPVAKSQSAASIAPPPDVSIAVAAAPSVTLSAVTTFAVPLPPPSTRLRLAAISTLLI